jgi:phosphoribosylformimino-5-aminoimidazole carboxamide ribotide isomerase
MQIIPAVDVLDGSVVRLLHGRYDLVTTYADDPVAAAQDWVADGASLVHVVDLNGARSGKPDPNLWHSLGRVGVPFQIGGGIRDQRTALQALEAGAHRVVLGTAAVHDPGMLREIVAATGADRVVASIDVRGGMAQGAGWTGTGVHFVDVVRRVVKAGVEVALVTGIERDGALNGPDLDLLAEVRAVAPELRLIASGGVSSLADIAALESLSCEAVIVGRALYENRLALPGAIRVASGAARRRESPP